MLTIYPYEKLGHVPHGWLDARHHFSFGSYYNPKRMSFGALRVINDDIIKAGTGFPTHPHKNMEIITYVRKGAISHEDSKGNKGRTKAGDVQVMSAGSGIYHSEYNKETIDTELYQIWIEPNQMNVEPRWDAHKFPKNEDGDALQLMVSGDGKAPLFIHQDAYIYAGRIKKGKKINHKIHHHAYLLVSKGEVVIEGNKLKKGDGAEITNKSFDIDVISDCELLVIDVPKS